MTSLAASIAMRVSPIDANPDAVSVAARVPSGRNVFTVVGFATATRSGSGVAVAAGASVTATAAARAHVRQRIPAAYAVLTGPAQGGTVAAVPTVDAELLTVTFVDSGGITRAKTVPATRAAAAATTGIGASTTFSVFTGLDAMGAAGGLEIPTGDLRLVADLDAHVVDGDFAWAPADLVDLEGAPWPTCARTFARRMEAALHDRGLRCAMTFETEFTAWDATGEPLHQQPAYGIEATRASGEFLLALVQRLQSLGVPVEQVHPEYSPGQLEVSVGVTGAVAAADRVVLVRDVIRTVARELGLRVSLSAKPAPDLLGNGAHLHVSLWRGDENLFGTGDDPSGLAPEARSFLAGLLAELPALLGVVCASPVSYLRLGPSRWAGGYGCLGVEERGGPRGGGQG